MKKIDDADQGILNSTIRIKMHKHISPITGTETAYNLKFSSALYQSLEDETVISSNKFTVQGIECELKDIPITGSTTRQVQVVSVATGNVVVANAGTVDLDNATVSLLINFDSPEIVKIYAKADSNDIAPKFNQLVAIEFDDPDDAPIITGEIDTIATQGSSGAASYTTFARHE